MAEEKDKKEYELAFWLKDENDFAKIKSLMDDLGLEITHTSEIRNIQFAYPIKKMTTGYFGFVHFMGSSENAASLNHTLRVEGVCLRYLLSKDPIKKNEIREMRRQAPERKAEKPVEQKSSDVVTNEELEKKLEEILK